MPRARLLKPGFFSNADLSEIPAHGRLLFAGLWTLADKGGRLKDEPRWIKGQLFPYERIGRVGSPCLRLQPRWVARR